MRRGAAGHDAADDRLGQELSPVAPFERLALDHPAEYEGERYLVAMLGREANWVRNVRAAGDKAVLRRGRSENVVLEEVNPQVRAPILQRYLEVAPGAPAHFSVDRHAPLEQFEQIADEYPVFRICPE